MVEIRASRGACREPGCRRPPAFSARFGSNQRRSESGRPLEYYSGVVIATVAVVAPPVKRRDLERALRSVIGPTEVAAGCVGCRLYRDMSRDDRLLLVTEWDGRAPLDAYFRSAAFRTVLAVMEEAAETPKFEVRTVSEPLGMEVIEAAWRRGETS
jgi:quinol monooxygenase YgiN